MTDLLFKTQKYMNGEDTLTVKGIDGKWKMEEIDKPQHKKKEKKDSSPSRKNDNKSMQAHTRSSSILEEELIESLDGKQLSHPWNLEHFKMYFC